jgi:putative NADPH-quinone reductase
MGCRFATHPLIKIQRLGSKQEISQSDKKYNAQGASMMKKILGIMGSPRRNGNTHILLTKILEGAEAEGVRGDILFLDDLTIQECNGCHACWEGKDCSKDDDMNSIYSKIIESDGIVFGTPVYWYGPTALMKGFIDRFVYFNCPENRAKIKGKPAVLAIPFEEKKPWVLRDEPHRHHARPGGYTQRGD